ncbi:MFS transporter [Curtobacterium ammoniigenes]|uniref:MFS transporter n=1 Tax=Curtobacterium ammoniigenes TaxID=395387 RepID=UPI0009F86FD9|nr:MFS transporter [Curtobacterium ammoniigenes]
MTATVAATDRGITVVAWRNSVFVVFTLSGLAIATWLGRVPTVRDSLHASTVEMALLVVGMSVGSILGLTVAGHVVSRFGARHGVQVATACLGVGLLAAGLVVSLRWGIAGLMPCLFVFGFGNGLCDVSMNVSGAAAERAGTRTIMPLFHAAFSLGTLGGAALGALAEAAKVPLVWHFGGTAVILAAAFLTAVRWFHDEHRIGDESEAHHAPAAADPALDPLSSGIPTGGMPAVPGRWAVWAMPGTLLIGIIVLGMALAEGSANDWLALAMVDGHGLTDAGGSAVLSVFVASMTVGRILGVVVIDRFGRVPVLRGSAILAIIGLSLLIVVPNTAIAIVGVICWGLGASLGFPVGMSAAAGDPRVAAARVSAVATIGYLAFLAGPLLIGFIGQQTGLLHALLVVLVFVIAAGVVSGAAREPQALRPRTGRDVRAG